MITILTYLAAFICGAYIGAIAFGVVVSGRREDECRQCLDQGLPQSYGGTDDE